MQDCLRLKSHSVRNQNAIQNQLHENRGFAQKNFDKLKSLEGIVGWRIKQLEESTISIEIKDNNIPWLFVLIDFKEDPTSTSGEVSCRARVGATRESENARGGRGRHSKRYHAELSSGVMAYVEQNMSKKCEELSSRILDSSSDIFNILNHVEWYIGRLALIGKELSVLERRHMGVLSRKVEKDGVSSCALNLTIETRGGQKVEASFEIGEAYPFAVLDVDLALLNKADIDINLLERQLTKTSKPGFGYLSRSCDIIASFQN
jgi:hypothetical protein